MKETQLKISGVIIVVIGALHLVRLLKGWEVTIKGIQVPVGFSGIAAFVFLLLGLWILKPLCCKK